MSAPETPASRRCPGVWLGDALGAMVARLPQPLLLAAGRLLALLAWPLMRRRRRIAARNLALCFPALDDGARARLLRATIRDTVTGMLELLRAWYAPPRALAPLLGSVEGLGHLRAALAAGRGVLLLGGHVPHAELDARLLLERLRAEGIDAPVRLVIRSYGRPCLERWIGGARRRAFGPTLGKKDTRGLVRVLSGGGIAALMADQDFSYSNVFVPFFGVPASTLASLPALVGRTGAALLPFWFHRDDAGRYHLVIEAAWDDWPAQSPEDAAARYMRALEARIAAHPSQYLWMHRRFKTRPPGEPSLY